MLARVMAEAVRQPRKPKDGVNSVSLDGGVPGDTVLGVRQLGGFPLDRVVRHEVGEVHGGGGGHGGSRVEAHVTESRRGGGGNNYTDSDLGCNLCHFQMVIDSSLN